MRGYLSSLFLLAALWGSSYFFIKVGVEDVAPAVLICGRTLVARRNPAWRRNRDARPGAGA